MDYKLVAPNIMVNLVKWLICMFKIISDHEKQYF